MPRLDWSSTSLNSHTSPPFPDPSSGSRLLPGTGYTFLQNSNTDFQCSQRYGTSLLSKPDQPLQPHLATIIEGMQVTSSSYPDVMQEHLLWQQHATYRNYFLSLTTYNFKQKSIFIGLDNIKLTLSLILRYSTATRFAIHFMHVHTLYRLMQGC